MKPIFPTSVSHRRHSGGVYAEARPLQHYDSLAKRFTLRSSAQAHGSSYQLKCRGSGRCVRFFFWFSLPAQPARLSQNPTATTAKTAPSCAPIARTRTVERRFAASEAPVARPQRNARNDDGPRVQWVAPVERVDFAPQNASNASNAARPATTSAAGGRIRTTTWAAGSARSKAIRRFRIGRPSNATRRSRGGRRRCRSQLARTRTQRREHGLDDRGPQCARCAGRRRVRPGPAARTPAARARPDRASSQPNPDAGNRAACSTHGGHGARPSVDRAGGHDWRHDRRYDWRDWRRRHRSHFRLGLLLRSVRLGLFAATAIGWRLWPSYYSSSFWLNDPWQYRLPPAYGPYRWIRYYDDALLVNIYNGQVVDVIYDFFW